MKYRYTICLMLVSIFISKTIQGQYLYEPTLSFRTIFNEDKAINSYYVGANPAFLFFDKSEELLTVQSTLNNSKGDFRRFIDPYRTTMFQQSASGKKTIDSVQVFKGSFGFQKLVRNKWDWLATKNYALGSPFLFGDSTSGQTTYNGIVMNAAYGYKIRENLLIGTEINYYVDEGLKEVSPKPTTKHRDINAKIGIGYFINQHLSIGFHTSIYDYFEKIMYREDEGSIYQETFLFKFRGYDFPQVLSKKVETRDSKHRGYFSCGTVSFTMPNRVLLAGYFGSGVEDLTVKDDALNPINSGFWSNSRYEGGLKSMINLASSLNLGLNYRFQLDDMWARHPSFEVLLMENKIPEHLFVGGLEYRISPKLTVGAEGGLQVTQYDNNDHFSDIYWKLDGRKLISSVGFHYYMNDTFQILAAYGYNKYTSNNETYEIGESSDLFSMFRYRDILYFQTDNDEHIFNLKMSIRSHRFGIFNIYFNYSKLSAQESDIFNNTSFDDLNVSLEYQMKVY